MSKEKGSVATAKKTYKVSRAARMQRRDAARKSASVRRKSNKWRNASVTERLYDYAVTKYGSVNEALLSLERRDIGKEAR